MKRALLLSALLAIAALLVTAFRLDGDPGEALKKIAETRAARVKEAQDAKTTPDFAAITAEIRKMAEDAVKGVDPNLVEPKQGYQWAQLFQTAGQTKNACDAAARYLTSNPGPTEKYAAQSLMISCCNALGEGHMVQMLVNDIVPPSAMTAAIFAQSTGRMYAPTIQKSEGLQAALDAISAAEKKIDFDQLLAAYKESNAKLIERNPQAKPADPVLQVENVRAVLGEARMNLYLDAGKKDEAMKVADETLAKIRPESTAARSLKATKIRNTLVGMPAPALAAERAYGEYKGLAALKGKVVIVDFFAHWCGPCIASFPDMKQMYADLHDKGLEVVGFTTYYGYYKGEGMPDRNMPRDTEFAKMGDFIEEYKLPWTVVLGERSIFEPYGVTGIPTGALIDRYGKVRDLHVGYSKETFAAFRKEVEKLLEEK